MANEAEQKRWNDDYWVKAWPRRERLTDQVTPKLLAHLEAKAGESILDVGCGGGHQSIAAAEAVGAEGLVVGYDLSAPLLDLARTRAGEKHATNVTFLVGDAQTAELEGGPFDAAMSQFGVMFFDEPAAAFANIREHVMPGGRLAFACWQPAEANTWNIGPLLARFAPPPPSPAAGRSPAGPFTLSDPERTAAMLDSAGWTDVTRTPYEMTVPVTADALVDRDQLAFARIPEERRGEAWAAVEAHLSGFAHSGEELEVPIAFQVFTARS